MSDINNDLAPIALFAFKRLPHLRATVEALAANDLANCSSLHVFCDGPRSDEDHDEVSQVRAFVDKIEGFAQVSVTHQPRNMGLADSIVTGVSKIVDLHGKVIVVEDDIVTSPFFLKFMNDSLSHYADDDRVGCVHGYLYPTAQTLPETFFLRGADVWGWATWKRAWAKFEYDPTVLLRRLDDEGLTAKFDMDGAFGFSELLRAFARKENKSWDACWYASTFLENMLTLYSGTSLVQNIGLDDTGTHCGASSKFDVPFLASRPIDVKPIAVEVNEVARRAVAGFYRSLSIPDPDDPPQSLGARPKTGFIAGLFEKLRISALNR